MRKSDSFPDAPSAAGVNAGTDLPPIAGPTSGHPAKPAGPLLTAVDPAPPLQPWLLALGLVISAATLLPLAAFRLIDGDEGYYLYAARLVMQGELPYRDFFYPQMPLLPYLYGAWMWFFGGAGDAWQSGRLLSALLGMLVGLMLYRHVERTTFSRIAALMAVVAFAGAGLIFAWFTVVKTYALTAALLFGALYLLMHPSGGMPWWLRSHLSGLLAALAIDARLIMAAAVPGLFYALWTSPDAELRERRKEAAMGFLGGFIVGLIPLAIFAAAAPAEFWFGNVEYHGLRSDFGLIGNARQKIETVLSLFGVVEVRGGEGLQFTLLSLAAFATLARSALERRLPPAALVVAAFLALGSLLPTPAYHQYFSLLVPFLIAGAAEGLFRRPSGGAVPGASSSILAPAESAAGSANGRTSLALLISAAALYLSVVAVDVYRYIEWGRQVPGPATPEAAPAWELANVRAVRAGVEARTRPGEPVLTWWPGYLVGSHARAVAGMENHFAQEIAGKLELGERRARHLRAQEDLERVLRERDVRVVVLGNWTGGWRSHLAPRYREVLLEAGYRPVEAVGQAEIFMLTDESEPAAAQ